MRCQHFSLPKYYIVFLNIIFNRLEWFLKSYVVRFKEYETIKKWYNIAMVGAKLRLILRKHPASLVARES